MIDFSNFNNIISLTTYFCSENKCKQTIIESRWADGDVVCPYCGEHNCEKEPMEDSVVRLAERTSLVL